MKKNKDNNKKIILFIQLFCFIVIIIFFSCCNNNQNDNNITDDVKKQDDKEKLKDDNIFDNIYENRNLKNSLLDITNKTINTNKTLEYNNEIFSEQTNYSSNFYRMVDKEVNEDIVVNIDTNLSEQEEKIVQEDINKTYEDKDCIVYDSLSDCIDNLNDSNEDDIETFYRPLVSGHVTSEWGTRFYGGRSFHEGIDMGTPEGSEAYSIGTGIVATTIPRSSCGGNMVVVHYLLNGDNYTAVFAHLLSINVSVGQAVTRDSIIGYTGGLSTQAYDRCTGGAHLHLTVSRGLYGIDYASWNQLSYTYSINPRDVINYPSGSGYWSDRFNIYDID